MHVRRTGVAYRPNFSFEKNISAQSYASLRSEGGGAAGSIAEGLGGGERDSGPLVSRARSGPYIRGNTRERAPQRNKTERSWAWAPRERVEQNGGGRSLGSRARLAKEGKGGEW